MSLFLMKLFNIKAKFNSGGNLDWKAHTRHQSDERDAGNSETHQSNHLWRRRDQTGRKLNAETIVKVTELHRNEPTGRSSRIALIILLINRH